MKVESESVFDTLVEISAGDLRRSINTLQTASAFKSQMLRDKDIQSISGVVPHDVVLKVESVVSNSQGFADIQTLAQDLILEGYDVQ